MLYISADTHTPHNCDKLNTKNFPVQKGMTKDDCVIIAGDFGLVWKNDETYEWWKKWFDNRNFTTLFVDGNHENFNWLEQFPVIEKFGGKVTEITDSIYHLRRGEIYEIDGKKIFTFGGAESIDKENRIREISWWKQEMPTYSEMNYGIDKLEEANFDVDIVITHTCPFSIRYRIHSDKGMSHLESYLDNIKGLLDDNNTKYQWFFGHFHKDVQINDFRAIYRDVVKVV